MKMLLNDCGDGWTTLEIFKAIELCTLNGWNVSYLNEAVTEGGGRWEGAAWSAPRPFQLDFCWGEISVGPSQYTYQSIVREYWGIWRLMWTQKLVPASSLEIQNRVEQGGCWNSWPYNDSEKDWQWLCLASTVWQGKSEYILYRSRWQWGRRYLGLSNHASIWLKEAAQ